ncbi:MAG: S8 family serine peptidase [Candidatus Zixiibacteriota bacterium]
MKNQTVIMLTIIVIFSMLSISSEAEHYYCRLGIKPLIECDSIVTVKFDPNIPGMDYEEFAFQVECLDESYPVEAGDRNFWIYHINSAFTVDSALEMLGSIPEVLLAFPAFKDSGGGVYKLSDLFVISFIDTVSQGTIDSLYAYYGIDQIEGPLEITGSRRVIITSQSPGNPLEIANLFYESGLVKYSQPAMIAPELHGIEPNDPLLIHQYFLDNGMYPEIDIDVKRAWEITAGANNVVVAVIDAGCIRHHEDFDSTRILWDWGWDYYDHDTIVDHIRIPVEDDDPSPGYEIGHGVACQGIISAKINNTLGIAGIASGCKIIPIKIFNYYGWGSSDPTIPEKAINRALGYFRFYKYVPLVISCSWGYRPGIYYDNIADIIDEAASLGVPIVFSSGNYGEVYYIGQSISFTAALETSIGVGAIDRDGDHWLYSGSGPGINAVAPSGDASIIYGDMYTTDQEGYAGYNPIERTCDSTSMDYICFFGGTSGACPEVAGILALVRSRRPDIKSFDTLRAIIDSSAIDGIGDYYDTPGWDPCYGNGLASAFRALAAVSRGDANNDGQVNMLDVNYIIAYLYQQGPAPVPDVIIADAKCDRAVNILDAIYIINYLYKGGPAPQICFEYDY